MIACSQLVGIFKLGISEVEREKFKSLYTGKFSRNIRNQDFFVESKNSIAFYRPLEGSNQQYEECMTGGACFLSVIKTASRPENLGIERFKSINGSWAMAIVDDNYGISIGIDVDGAQSIFYSVVNDSIYFTSSLTLFEKLSFEINPDAVTDFLHFLYIPAPRTIYCEVKSVLPGQVICFDGNKLKTDCLPKKNFTKNQEGNLENLDYEKLLSNYEKLLKKSVSNSVSKFGRTALFLSGGKDSSALAIAANRAGLKNVEAVTFGFEEHEIDESADAKIVADYLGIPFSRLSFSREDYIKDWPEFIRSLGQPLGDCAAVPIFSGIKELKNRYDLYLDGTGIDRYMGVTTTWQEDFAWLLHRKIPHLHRLPWKLLRNNYSYSIDVIANYLQKRREEQFVSWNGWTAKEILIITGRKPKWENIELYKLYKRCSSSMVHKTQTITGIWGVESCKRKVVQISNVMHKLVRFPFLDKELVEFSQSLPSEYQYKGHINKIILRAFLKKYLPDQIVNKKKGAFIFPKNYILDSNSHEFLDIFLSSGCIQKHALVDYKIVRSYVKEYRDGNRSMEDRIWALVILHSWAEFCHSN
jgi:asparagine synthase (glutamine-hydrolysing)